MTESQWPGGVPAPSYPPSPPIGPPPPPVPPSGPYPANGMWWVTPSPAPPPGPNRTPWFVAGAALAVVALLVAGVAFAVRGDGTEQATPRRERERVTTTTVPVTEPPATAPPATTLPPNQPADFVAVVDEIKAFVSQERGLPFLRDVAVTLLDEAAFSARIIEENGDDTEALQDTEAVFQALGLIGADVDLVAALQGLLGGGVVGFYVPDTEELVVRGTELTPYVRMVMAHELTHALDDQHFELDRPELEGGDERDFGFSALVEGNAVRVERAYIDSLSAGDQGAVFEAEASAGAGIDFDAIPSVLLDFIGAPYLLGPEVVDALLAAGGQARLDAAFGDPPATSEHVLDPSVFIRGEGAVPVASPVADGDVFDEGAFGAFLLAALLDGSGLAGAFDPSAAVEGWGGDAYVAWSDGPNRACIRAAFIGDTADDTIEIDTALREWVADAPSDVVATVVPGGGGTTVLTSCG